MCQDLEKMSLRTIPGENMQTYRVCFKKRSAEPPSLEVPDITQLAVKGQHCH
jgi:hypothetical protein